MRRTFCLFLVGLILVGCGGDGSEPGPAPVPDGPRIVSLSPGITETLFELGLGDRVVGRSDYCDYPDKALALPTAGTSLAPNFEAVARLAPTVILVEANQTSHRKELGNLAEVVELPWLELNDVVQGVRELGRRFDATQTAETLAGRLEQRLGVDPPADGVRVLLTLGANVDGSPLWYIRRNSLHGAALHAAGGRNAVDRDVMGNVSLSVEGLLSLDPEVIVALLPDSGEPEALRAQVEGAFAKLTTLQAVQSGRIGVVPGAGYLRTGPRVLQLVDALTAELARLEESAP